MSDLSEDGAVLLAIMEAAVDAMVVSDHSGMILRANAAAAELFQIAPDDVL
jgi:PAS domain-containing protein